MGQRAADRLGKPLIGRACREQRAIDPGALGQAPDSLQRLRLLEQSGQQIGIEREGAVETGYLLPGVSRRAMGFGEVEPDGRRLRVRRRRARQIADGSAGIAHPQRDQPQRIERDGMIRLLRNGRLQQQPRLIHPPLAARFRSPRQQLARSTALNRHSLSHILRA